MRGTDYSDSLEFIERLFGASTEHDVELRSFPDAKNGSGAPRAAFGRDFEDFETHLIRFDEAGRGMYYGVCTREARKGRGRREDVRECPAVWTDIDAYHIDAGKDDIISALQSAYHPPSVIIDSGGGIQALWMLSEAVDVSEVGGETEEQVLDVLRRICGVFCGDVKVIDLARVMRLPGTINAKHGEERRAHVVEASWALYELDDLTEWLDWQRPVIKSLEIPDTSTANPWTDNLEERFGRTSALDVKSAVEAMSYGAGGSNSIHQTQLVVSASMVSKGHEDNEIADLLLEATRAAAGLDGERWNWKREEKAIRQMIRTAREKFGPEVRVEKQREKIRAAADPTDTDPTEGLIFDKDGKLVKRDQNIINAIIQHPDTSHLVRFNQLTQSSEADVCPWQRLPGVTWRDTDDTKLRIWLQQTYECDVPVERVRRLVDTIAEDRAFNPISEYLSDVRWDGKERLSTWLHRYCSAADNRYTRAVSRAWMIGAVARALTPGCQADYMLVLEGPQGVGKSRAARVLAGDPGWFTDSLYELSGKTSFESIKGKWIVEVGELAGMRKTEVNAVKAFLTATSDYYRPPYERRAQDFPRRCIFIGTVNPGDMGHFKDETGNRRFWLVPVGAIDHDSLITDRNQIWAEAVAAFKAGEPHYLTDPDIIADAEAIQRDASTGASDEWLPLVERYITHSPPATREAREDLEQWSLRSEPLDRLKVRDVLVRAIGVEDRMIKGMEQGRVGAILRYLGWNRVIARPKDGGPPSRHFVAPDFVTRPRPEPGNKGGNTPVKPKNINNPKQPRF